MKTVISNLISLSLISLAFVFYSCEKEVSTSPGLHDEPLSFVYLDSEPSGARIYVDDRDEGIVTPDSLSWLDVAEHKFTLKLENYRDTVFYLKTDKEQKIYMDIKYNENVKMLGRIFVKCNADSARIFLDGKLTGEFAPDTIYNVIPGTYRIKLEADGFREDSTVVHVKSNATADAGFYLRDTSVWVDYSMSTSGIAGDYLSTVEIDQNKVVWIGTNGDGLVSYDGKTWTTYNTMNSQIPGDFINDIAVDENNAVWIATSEGAAILDNGMWTVFTMDTHPVMESNYVNCIEFSNDYSRKWLGTRKGLIYQTSGGSWGKIQTKKYGGLPHDWISALKYDGNGNLWIGTLGYGLIKYSRTGSWVKYFNPFVVGFTLGYYKVLFPSNSISTIGSLDAKIWNGHYPDPMTGIGGVSIFTGNYWLTDLEPLPSKNVYKIKNDNNGRTWICTAAGLVTYRTSYPNRRVYEVAANGLKVADIRDIAFDEENHIAWVATYGGGVYKFKNEY